MNNIIKTRRKELGITLEAVGSYVGVSKGTVQRWETGNISNMRRDKIKKLAQILQLDSKLLLEEIYCDGNETDNSFGFVPVLEMVAEGVPLFDSKDITDWEQVPQWAENQEMFALKLTEDSMEPRMAEGDIVIVQRQNDVESGQLAIVKAEGQITCKKVVKHSEGLVLVSNNSKYAPVFFSAKDMDEKVEILGRVVELRARF